MTILTLQTLNRLNTFLHSLNQFKLQLAQAPTSWISCLVELSISISMPSLKPTNRTSSNKKKLVFWFRFGLENNQSFRCKLQFGYSEKPINLDPLGLVSLCSLQVLHVMLVKGEVLIAAQKSLTDLALLRGKQAILWRIIMWLSSFI